MRTKPNQKDVNAIAKGLLGGGKDPDSMEAAVAETLDDLRDDELDYIICYVIKCWMIHGKQSGLFGEVKG